MIQKTQGDKAIKNLPIVLLLLVLACSGSEETYYPPEPDSEPTPVAEVEEESEWYWDTCTEYKNIPEEEIIEFANSFHNGLDPIGTGATRFGFDTITQWESTNITIQIADNATDTERDMIEEIVRRLNEILPEPMHIGDDITHEQAFQIPPEGTVYFQFCQTHPARDCVLARTRTNSAGVYRHYGYSVNMPRGVISAYSVKAYNASPWKGATVNDEVDAIATFRLYTHELLHALGLRGHSDNISFTPKNRSSALDYIEVVDSETYPGELDCALLDYIYNQ